MQLTLYTDYSLRVLLYLSLRPDERVSIEEISSFYKISKDHLIKVVNHLGKVGYIKTLRGRNGGIEMAKPPEQLTIGEVVRTMEPHFNLVECFNPQTNHCVVTPVCGLKHILAEANSAFLDVLDQYTISDMVDDKETAYQLLQIKTVKT